MKWMLLLALAALFLLPSVHASNSCVDCHKKPEVRHSLPQWPQDNYALWAGSVHAAQGFTCDKCKGGDPTKPSKELAHAGIKSSRDPSSPLYYLNIPETCGACHLEVYHQFTSSKHFINLKRDRIAPSCITCHGTHAVTTVDPEVIGEKCSLCHNEDTGIEPQVALEARNSLKKVKEVENTISGASEVLWWARIQKGTMADTNLHRATKLLSNSSVLFHSFNLPAFNLVIQESLAISKLSLREALLTRNIYFLIGIDLIIVLFILYLTRKKKTLFAAFSFYLMYLVIYYVSVRTGGFRIFTAEAASLLYHNLEALFFLVFGYGIIWVMLDTPMKMVARTVTHLLFLLTALFSVTVLAVEGRSLLFGGTVKEFFFTFLKISMVSIIISVIYHSWKTTRHGNLLVYEFAFGLFLLAFVAHAYYHIWGYWTEYIFSNFLKNVLETGALIILAYAVYRSKE